MICLVPAKLRFFLSKEFSIEIERTFCINPFEFPNWLGVGNSLIVCQRYRCFVHTGEQTSDKYNGYYMYMKVKGHKEDHKGTINRYHAGIPYNILKSYI